MILATLEKSLFEMNEHAADENRSLLKAEGVMAVNVLGGDGCGKTALLEAVIPRLKHTHTIGVLEGDLATTKDAARIAALNVPVVQLLTQGGCHLTATLTQHGLRRLPLGEMDIVFIENVGNPICPVNFDLGEHLRVSVLSVTEGDDKPAKYPFLFKVADRVVITKHDLIGYTDFHLDQAVADIRKLNPDVEVLTNSLGNHSGAAALADWVHTEYLRYLARVTGDLHEWGTSRGVRLWHADQPLS